MATATEIKQLEAKIKDDVKQINELPKIAKAVHNDDKTIANAAVQSMRRVLVFFIEKGDLSMAASNSSESKKSKPSAAQQTFRKWLWSIYLAFIKDMLEWIGSDRDSNLQVSALRTLMEFVSRERELKGKPDAPFQNETFMRVIQQLMAMPKIKGEVASVFKGEYVSAYMDVQYYMLKNVAQLLEKAHSKDGKEDQNDYTLVANALKLLGMVNMPESKDDITSFLVTSKQPLPDDELVSDDDSDSDDENEEVQQPVTGSKRTAEQASGKNNEQSKARGLKSVKQHEHAFSQAWIALLRHSLPQDSYKKILVKLPDEIMPHLTNPLLLSDFLTDSYDVGGVTSLLALNSLFILIQDYNFDSPDFYNKLYELLEDPTLISAKQRSRFFHLLELFLSSTHLPAYMIAAYAKRLSRLSLVAEPGAILFIIPMVYNLILRHKECLQLIHRTGTTTVAEKALQRREELSSANAVEAAAKKLANQTKQIELKDGNDPFLSSEKDPIKCNALQSSLWELATMKDHYNADVAVRAKIFEERLRHQFVPLDDVMDISYKSLFESQLKRKVKGSVPLAFQPCTSVFTEEDGFATVFAL